MPINCCQVDALMRRLPRGSSATNTIQIDGRIEISNELSYEE